MEANDTDVWHGFSPSFLQLPLRGSWSNESFLFPNAYCIDC